MSELLFWWTGLVVWSVLVVLLFLCGLPSGKSLDGVTRITFYDFGVVLWRVTPENADTLKRFMGYGYHIVKLNSGYHLGLSLPTWLSRRVYRRRP